MTCMSAKTVIFVSIPGLRRRDLAHMPRLQKLAAGGSSCDLIPSFPCVTSPVQASLLTGTTPDKHGIIGNGFYHRERGEVEMWVGRNVLVQGKQIWDVLKNRGITSAAWMTQNIKDAAADYIVTPEPIHHPDGRMDLWCYSTPDGLYKELLNDLGHFPLMNYWGPMTNIKSTEWIINAALWLIQRKRPQFNHVYVPHLDYAAQKFGPNAQQQIQACGEADQQLGRLFDGVSALGVDATHLVVGEYAMTDVSRVIYPNRILRDAGMLQIDLETRPFAPPPGPPRPPPPPGPHEYLNVKKSKALAVVDHQFAHVYVQDKTDIDGVAGMFEGVPGIAHAYYGDDRKQVNLSHQRSGEVVLVCEPDTWLAYYWWNDDAKAPPFARTVDIHSKPGYDPVEMFIDPPTMSIPLNAKLIKGSHGAPAKSPDQYGACVSSTRDLPSGSIKDTDIFQLITRQFS